MTTLRLHRRKDAKDDSGLSDKTVGKILKSKKVTAATRAKAEAVQTYWKSIAPVFNAADRKEHRQAPEYGEPGAYRDSITITDISDDDGPGFRVGPTDFKARWIEFGNAHMPEYAPKAKVLAKFRK